MFSQLQPSNKRQFQGRNSKVKSLKQSYLDVVKAGTGVDQREAPVHQALMSKLTSASLSDSSSYVRGGASTITNHKDLNPLGLI